MVKYDNGYLWMVMDGYVWLWVAIDHYGCMTTGIYGGCGWLNMTMHGKNTYTYL